MISNIQKKFIDKYIEWTLSECEKEVKNDFPILKKINNTHVIYYLNLIKYFRPEEKRELAITKVRSINNKNYLKDFESFKKEMAVILKYDSHEKFSQWLLDFYGGPDSPWRKKLEKFDRKKTKLIIKEQLPPILGKIRKGFEAGEWIFKKEIDDFAFDTHIVLKFQYNKVTYSQQVYYKDQLLFDNFTYFHILSILGVSQNSEAEFERIDDTNFKENIDLICKFSNYFIDAAVNFI